MTNSAKESFKANASDLGDKIKALVHEGNVRRLIVKRGDDTIAEFPLTAAVVGAVLAPPVQAVDSATVGRRRAAPERRRPAACSRAPPWW